MLGNNPIGAIDEMESEIYWYETYGHSLKAFTFLRWFFTQEIDDGIYSVTLTGDDLFIFDFEKSRNIIKHTESIQELFDQFSKRLFSAEKTYMLIGSKRQVDSETEVRVYAMSNDEIIGLDDEQIKAVEEFSLNDSETKPHIVIPKEWYYSFKDIPRGLIT